MFALREYQEFSFGPRKSLNWNMAVPIFEGLYQRGLSTIEREKEMFRGYVQN